MKLNNLKKKFRCLACDALFVLSTDLTIKDHKTQYGTFDGVPCIKCGSFAKHFGYVSGISTSPGKDNRARQRDEYKNDLIQPYREGEFSKEFRDQYPDISKEYVKDGAITKEQYDNAKDVWR